MTDPLPTIAAHLAAALRSLPCRCTRNYDMKVTKQCAGCIALAEHDAYCAIVADPRRPPKEQT